jgi:hypothetical protein
MKFYGKEFELDFETLQDEFDENFDDYRDWLDTLDSWDTDLLEEKGLVWELVPDVLAEVIYSEELEEDDEEEDE